MRPSPAEARIRLKIQVIVGAEIEDLRRVAIVADPDSGLLRAGNQSFLLEKALFFEGFGLLGEGIQELRGHGFALGMKTPQSISGVLNQ